MRIRRHGICEASDSLKGDFKSVVALAGYERSVSSRLLVDLLGPVLILIPCFVGIDAVRGKADIQPRNGFDSLRYQPSEERGELIEFKAEATASTAQVKTPFLSGVR